MTISTIPTIMKRIKSAGQDSPIAVFKTDLVDPDRKLDAVFAATVLTSSKLRGFDPLLVGCFDKTMSVSPIRRKLNDAIGANK